LTKEIGLNPGRKSIRKGIYNNNFVIINPFSNENTLPNLSNIGLNRLARSRNLRRVAAFLTKHKASTLRILCEELRIPKSSLIWALHELVNLGMIRPLGEIRNERGRSATIYATHDASEEDVKRTRIRHRRLSSPKYRAGERLAQTLLTEYLEKREQPEITFREILLIVREVRLPYNPRDIAEIVARHLSELGVKVWR